MNKLILSRVPLFSRLPQSEIEHLAATLHPCQMPEQTVFVHEGKTDDTFFILMEGEVEIIKAQGTPDERTLARRGPGTLIGEMSLFVQGHAHTASVRSLTPLSLLEITNAEFDALLLRQPKLAYDMVGMLASRLEEADNLTILDLREKNRQLTIAYEELKAAQAQIIEKERLERELEIARQIQISILPQEIPKPERYELGARMNPARAVGGDFYDFILLSPDQVGIVVGDVSDKGVPAALFMALTYSLVRAEASRVSSPADTLRRVNRHLLDINVSNMFVTMLFGILNCKTGQFDYARAGHPHPIILDGAGNNIKVPTRAGQPLGLFDEFLLDEQSVSIPGDGLALLYSDGISEAMDTEGQLFGEDRLYRALASNSQANAQKVCDNLWELVNAYIGSYTQQDDFTAVLIKGLA